jgi:hypothetical protein
LLEYVEDDLGADRETVETALLGLELVFAFDQAGRLLLNIEYSAAYLMRHSTGMPTGVDITEPESVSPHNDPNLDRQDAFLHLASNDAAIVLAAEEALNGTIDTVNDVDIEASFEDIFETDKRRSVFAWTGLLEERIDDESINEHIEESSPLSMGHDSVFTGSIPTETRFRPGRGRGPAAPSRWSRSSTSNSRTVTRIGPRRSASTRRSPLSSRRKTWATSARDSARAATVTPAKTGRIRRNISPNEPRKTPARRVSWDTQRS